MHTDQIADMFTRIRNAIHAKKKTVSIPASNIRRDITRVLHENHFISKYAFVDSNVQGEIKILLKYTEELESAIQGIQKVSTPGKRIYRKVEELPKVLNGMGVCIVSTSKGIMTDHECRKYNVSGELIGKVW